MFRHHKGHTLQGHDKDGQGAETLPSGGVACPEEDKKGKEHCVVSVKEEGIHQIGPFKIRYKRELTSKAQITAEHPPAANPHEHQPHHLTHFIMLVTLLKPYSWWQAVTKRPSAEATLGSRRPTPYASKGL